jgi:hypothetical protein
MVTLRTLSARPQVVVDNASASVRDPAAAFVGVSGPLGRNRLLSCLPLNKSQPVQLQSALVLAGSDGSLLGDPAGAILGERQAVWCHRHLTATRTINTRFL